MIEDRRIGELKIEGAYGLAILYTLGFLGLIGTLMFFEVPEKNQQLLNTLAGFMGAVQLGIIKFYYDGSKGAQQVQQANIERSARTEAAIQEIAKTAPAVTAAAVAAAVPKATNGEGEVK